MKEIKNEHITFIPKVKEGSMHTPFYTFNKVIAGKPYEVGYSDKQKEGERADDTTFVVDIGGKGKATIYFGIFGCVVTVFFVFLAKIDLTNWFSLLLFGSSFLFFVFWFVYGFIAPPKYLIFNRKTGIISIPRIRKRVDINFGECVALQKSYIVHGVYSADLILQQQINNKKKKVLLYPGSSDQDVESYWAFVVWYMDKNRPLPPGTAFDPYRQKDFERRKAEGFPKPLYPSYYDTPEVTRQQQKEREKYWYNG